MSEQPNKSEIFTVISLILGIGASIFGLLAFLGDRFPVLGGGSDK